MCKNLFSIDGFDRLKEIYALDSFEIGELCRSYKFCKDCPLGISYLDEKRINRTLCVDATSKGRVFDILKKGGRFSAKKH